MRVAMLSVHTSPLAQLGGWETGGMNVYVHELSRTLGNRGIDVDVFTRRQDASLETVTQIGPNARLIQLDAGPPRHFDKYAVLEYLPDLACNLQRFRNFSGATYDVIHAHYWLSGRLALPFRDRWRAPLVSTFHTLGHMKNDVAQDDAEREEATRIEIERRVMTCSDRVIASTPVDEAQLVKLYGVSPRKISVVAPGVDLERFRPIRKHAARTRLNLGPGPVILFVGRIQRLKGIDILLQAVSKIDELSPALRPRVVIVGGSPEGERVEAEQREVERLVKLGRALGIADRVTFAGSVPQDELPYFYAAADVTIMPSTYESFGLVALESMACGTPVVATRVGGLSTLVRDGETGYLVPWRDPLLFAQRIAELLTNPASHRQMRQQARSHAAAYGWDAAAQATERVYAQLVNSHVALEPTACV
ncbi:MAG: glycosyltransferase [Chloroflexota bacterium]